MVTFSNAGSRGGSGPSAQNIDISGDGSLQSDEPWVRSVPCRTTFSLSTPVTTSAQVSTLTGISPPSIGVTGTVDYTNSNTNIGGGTGTESFDGSVLPDNAAQIRNVSVDVAGGAGTITITAIITAPTINTFVQTGLDPITFQPISYYVQLRAALNPDC